MFKRSKLVNEPKEKVLHFTKTLKENYTIVEYTTYHRLFIKNKTF